MTRSPRDVVRDLVESLSGELAWSDTDTLFLGNLRLGGVREIPDSGEWYWWLADCAPIGITATVAPEPIATWGAAREALFAHVSAAIVAWKKGESNSP